MSAYVTLVNLFKQLSGSIILVYFAFVYVPTCVYIDALHSVVLFVYMPFLMMSLQRARFYQIVSITH